MEISDTKLREYSQRLIMSRMRLLNTNGFYGLLLMHAAFSLDEELSTAATDGNNISFAPSFMDEIDDGELDFVLMHEIMHIALGHCFRQEDRDNYYFNIACDIVVNSNILRSCGMNKKSITLARYGESMHKAPDGKEGYEYTAEQVYEMLVKKYGKPKKIRAVGASSRGGNTTGDSVSKGDAGETLDSHDRWGANDDAAAEWESRVMNAAEAMSSRGGNGAGKIPLGVERVLNELKNPQIDWRTILNDFVQEDVCDYSFVPPDRRFDGDFFLPDFNEKDETVRDVLFMIDTSGSMSDDAVTSAYSEVYCAIEQFGGKLEGLLGFFDAAVVPPKPFAGPDEFSIIRPKGGGGTSFYSVFEYVKKHMTDKPPVCIIIMTDGYAPFPDQPAAQGVPVLWLIVGSKVKPPWGKVARIEG